MVNVNIVHNVYRIKIANLEHEYTIVFGNVEHGWNFKKEALVEAWRVGIHKSQSMAMGDVSLFKRGKLIRSLHNAEIKILYKKDYGKYKRIKYE